ncbi:MAG: DUF4212 domain-containing protein [Cyanobacteria bacterium]|nr:DUF4212 domain-containing protein [Cyanobacteriota bacterium]MDA0864978.1 DUF4212 domain-containing protein [Cyanobacteriota bacterium]
MHQNKSQRYWQDNLALIRNLLLIWAATTFGMAIALAKFLNHIYLGRLPLGFWIAQQGALLVFVVLTFVYASRMEALDRKCDSKHSKNDENN